MKIGLLVVAGALAFGYASTASAQVGFSFGVTVPAGGYYAPPPMYYYAPPPRVYYAPPPVYYGPPAYAYYGRPYWWHHHHHHWR